MKRVSLVQTGFGTVGGALIEQVLDNRERWRETYGIDVTYAAVSGRSGALVADDEAGISGDQLRELVAGRRAGQAGPTDSMSIDDVLAALVERGPTVLLDAVAGEQTAAADCRALDMGAGVVLSNKAPLALPMDDPRAQVLWSQTGANGHLLYEATCGAGLPVISALRSLLDTGDEVLEITGTVSGTFGAIFSAVAAGTPFSVAVREAREQGYTEPDPRDDLSGLDVARKGLILARTMGHAIDLDDIDVLSLVPDELAHVTIEEFLDRLDRQDAAILNQAEAAAAAEATLKYIVRWSPDSGVTVGLDQVPRATVLGALQGPENIVSFRTVRYDQYPCVISGPGAGAAVTAAGMVADLLTVARRLDG